MLRIWTESKIAVVSEDAEFLGTLAAQIESHFEMTIFDSQAVNARALHGCEDSLILWDLGTLPHENLETYLSENEGVLRTCSLIVVTTEQKVDEALLLTEQGAVDFIVKPVRPAELHARLKLGRRPWVRSMHTTFDFLDAMNVEFTTMEQKILLCFLASPDFAASRSSINLAIWNDSNITSNSLDVHLFNIRRKIEPSGLRIKFNNQKAAWCLSQKGAEDEEEMPAKNTRVTSKPQQRS